MEDERRMQLAGRVGCARRVLELFISESDKSFAGLGGQLDFTLSEVYKRLDEPRSTVNDALLRLTEDDVLVMYYRYRQSRSGLLQNCTIRVWCLKEHDPNIGLWGS